MHRSIRGKALGRWLLPSLLLVLAACSDHLVTEPDAMQAPVRAPGSASANLQATPAGYIRVGVIPSATSIQVGGTAEFVMRNKATGDVIYSGDGEQVTVTLGSGAVSTTRYRLQVTCTSETGRDALIDRAEAAGVESYTENAGPCWRVMLGSFPSDASFSIRNAFRNEMIALGLSGTDSFWKLVTTVTGTTEYRITHAGGTLVSSALIVIEPLSGTVLIGGKQYRGIGEVATNSSGALAGINELPMEEYLYGVVPNELPPVPYGLAEAQKAQAVTARTYAYANLGKRKADGYDLLPTTSDQVYKGYESEAAVSTAAVDATRGIVAVSGGKLITTLYHSTSGGYTANSEDVYSAALSYLRGVPDAPRGQALEHVPTLEVFKRHGDPTNLRGAAAGDYEADWSRYHRWVVDWSAAEMAAVLSSSFATTVTRVDAITVDDRADHGRVRQIRFSTDAGELIAQKDLIRSKLRYFDSRGNIASLRSTLFFIEPVTDPKTKAITGWKAYGGGWGHGVGMSQTGAVGMAEKGSTYEEILKHYYQGVGLAAI